MKRIKIFTSAIAVSGMYLFLFTQNALADMLPPDGGWKVRTAPAANPEPKSFIDLIEPIHVAIGIIVLVVVIVSFVVLSKARKK